MIMPKFFRIKYILPFLLALFCFFVILFTSARHIAQLDVFRLSGDVSAVYLDVLHKKDDLLSYSLKGEFYGTFQTECLVYDNEGNPAPSEPFQSDSGSGELYESLEGYRLKVDGLERQFDGGNRFIIYRDHASGKNFYSGQSAVLYPYEVYLTHVDSFLSDGSGRLLLLNEASGMALLVDSQGTEKFTFSLSPLAETSAYLLLWGGLFCLLLWLVASLLLSDSIFTEIKSTCKNNKIIFILLTIWSFGIFAIFYPGMQTADNHFATANALSYIDSLGAFYMWFNIMVRAIGLHNAHLLMLVLFFITFYNIIYLMDKLTVKYLLKIAFLLLCILSPAVVFALMEEKRLATTAMLFYAALSFFLRIVLVKSEKAPSIKNLLPFIILYSAAILCRPDYIIFAPFLIVIGVFKLRAQLSWKRGVVYLALSVLVPTILWQLAPPFSTEYPEYTAYYKMIPKIHMISPYVSCNAKDNPDLIETLDELGGYKYYCEQGPRKFRWEMHKRFWALQDSGGNAQGWVDKHNTYLTKYFFHYLQAQPLKFIKQTADRTLQLAYSMFHWYDKYTILEKRRGSAQTFIGARFFYDQDYGEGHRYFYDRVASFYFKTLQTPLKFGLITLFCVFILYPVIFRRTPAALTINLSCLAYVGYLGAVSPEPGLAYMLPAALWVSYGPAIAALEHFYKRNL